MTTGKTTKGQTAGAFNIRTSQGPQRIGVRKRDVPFDVPPSGEVPRPRLGEEKAPSAGEYEEPQGLYIISVAARLLDMHPQTLRKYERAGLISPPRTMGMLRLYSEEDILRLRLIKHLVDDLGLNLAGVSLALNLVNGLLALRRHLQAVGMDDMKGFLDEEMEALLDTLYRNI